MGKLAIEKNQLVKEYHKLIDIIRHTDHSDIKSIASKASVSFPTLKMQLEKMLSKNIITETNNQHKRFAPNKEFGFFLGIAVGATETKVVVTDFSLEPIKSFNEYKCLLKRFKIQLEKKLGKSLSNEILCFKTHQNNLDIHNLCSTILELAIELFENDMEYDLLGVGISLPGIVDKNTGEISFSPNISKLITMPAKKIVRSDIWDKLQKAGISCHICHDTVAATVAEKEWLYTENNPEREQKDSPNMATVYMGYGLGCGYIINNGLVCGASGAVGEIGHLIAENTDVDIDENNKHEKLDKEHYFLDSYEENNPEKNIDISFVSCACGNTNCLEKLIRIKVFNSNDVENFSNKTNHNHLTSFATFHPYRYKVMKHYIAVVLSITVNILNVDLIVLSGRIFNGIPELKKDVEALLSKYSLTASSKYCKIITGSCRDDVVAVGAATLSYYNIFSNNERDFFIQW